MGSHTRRRRAGGLVTAAVAAAVAALPASTTGAAFSAPTWLRQIGAPGHAFVYAWGMATETDGSIVVGDYNNYQVRVFSPSGTLLRSFGHRGNPPSGMGQPQGIAVDRNDGSIYVGDINHNQTLKYTAQGQFLYGISNPNIYYAPWIATDSQGDVLIVQSLGLEKTSPDRVYTYNNAGGYVGVFGTNGSSCSQGQFSLIRGIDVDAADNIYVNDVGNHCVQVFDRNHHFLRSFGNGTQLSGNTRGLAVDRANGVVYVADAGRQVVVAYSTAGHYLGTIGTPGSDSGQLGGPRGLTVGADGTLYVADYTYWRVNAYQPLPSGAFLHEIPDPPVPPPPGGLNDAVGVVVSPANGHVYVSDTFNHRVQEFTGVGGFVTMWGARLPDLSGQYSMDYPRGVAVDPTTGNVWVNDTRSGYIKAYTPSGTFVREFGGQGSGPTQFFYAIGIAAGPDGSLYIPDSANSRLKKTNQAGTPAWIVPCGTFGGDPGGENGCTGVALDAAGNVYAASVNEGVVDVFSPSGALLRHIGASAPSGRLAQPYGVAVQGNTLYVTESGRDRVSVFSLTGSYLGGWGSTGSGHGQFSRPMELAVDSGGNVYVNDYGNERIEVFAP